MMRTCNHCGKEYNPCEDFIEEYEISEALSFFLNCDNYCSDCLTLLHERLDEVVDYFTGTNDRL